MSHHMTATHPLESLVDAAFERRADITPGTAPRELLAALDTIVAELNAGRLRVAEKIDGAWITHQWIKKAVLLYFRTHDNTVMAVGGGLAWFDRVPLRFEGHTAAQFREGGFRAVPPATVRTGTFIGKNVVLMPSYVNIGAYVDEGTMVDTWATVGSCAQIGKNVHLSGGVGIGGVLEPIQANPTIIEDHCFIGARSEIVEGVIVRRTRSSRWACSSGRARKSTIARLDRCTTVACHPDPSSCPEAFPPTTAPTPWRARSS
jgi:2,3,4,5-tetrahydropyridine-2,6-dicarboxylate N-succinyltransferase